MATMLGTIGYKFIADTAGFESGLTKLQGGITKFGAQTAKIGKGLTVGLTAPLVAFATAAIKAGVDVDDAMDRIREATGATGARLEGLEKVWRGLMATVPATGMEIADAISVLATRTSLAGPALQAMATQYLNLARITGSDLEPMMVSLTRTMGAFGIAANEQGAALDYLYRTTTTTGIGIDRLGELMTQHAVPLQQLGYGFEQSAALLGQFEKAGIATEPVLMALKTGLGELSKNTPDLVGGLQSVIQQIQNAGSVSAANAIAIEAFGMRSGPLLAAAILEGKLAVGDLTAVIAGGKDTINAAAYATFSLGQKLQRLRNQAILALEPVGTQMIDALEDLIPVAERALKKIAGLAAAFASLNPGTQQGILGFGLFLAAIGPVTYAISGLATAIKWLVPVFGLLTGPIGLIGLALVAMWAEFQGFFAKTGSWVKALLATMTPLYSVPLFIWESWPWLREKLTDLWDGIVSYIKTVPVAIINSLLSLPGQVYDLFLAMAGNAWKAFKAGLGIGSPSLVERAFTAIKEHADDELTRIESRLIQASGSIGAAAREIAQVLTSQAAAAAAAVAVYMAQMADAAIASIQFWTEKTGLQLQLWALQNRAASDSAAYLQQQILLNGEALAALATQIPIVEAQYKLLAAAKGANSEEARKLYLQLLQLQIAQAELLKGVDDATAALKAQVTAYELLIQNGERYIKMTQTLASGQKVSFLIPQESRKERVEREEREWEAYSPEQQAEINEIAARWGAMDTEAAKAMYESNKVAGWEGKQRAYPTQAQEQADINAIAARQGVDLIVGEAMYRANKKAWAAGKVPEYGFGGVVTRPTLAMVGERGPEAIIPLTGNAAPGTTINLTITGNTIASDYDADRLGEKIVRHLRRLGVKTA